MFCTQYAETHLSGRVETFGDVGRWEFSFFTETGAHVGNVQHGAQQWAEFVVIDADQQCMVPTSMLDGRHVWTDIAFDSKVGLDR